MFDNYRITVLVENSADSEGILESEHGLSLFVETPETSFIFDCGQSGMAWRNAERLGVDLKTAVFVVLSHSHYDHAGGFPSLLTYMKPQAVYTGPDFWQEKFSKAPDSNGYLYKGCGFKADDLETWGIEHRVCSDAIPLDDYAMLVTGFEQRNSFETIPEKFCRGVDKEPDSFSDEICLLLKGADGITMVVGCSHRGILNIATSVTERIGRPIHRIVGGIHLSGCGAGRIERTLTGLKDMGVEKLNLCHCSGIDLPGRISAGAVISF